MDNISTHNLDVNLISTVSNSTFWTGPNTYGGIGGFPLPNTTYNITSHTGGTDSSRYYKEIEERLKTIEHCLCILDEDSEAHKNFPALKEAYEHYKMLEALCKGTKNE